MQSLPNGVPTAKANFAGGPGGISTAASPASFDMPG